MSREVLSHQFELAFPTPGTTPVPEGHVRLFHYTDNEGLAGIRKEGIKLSASRGHTYGEPNLVWASAGVPNNDPDNKLFHNKNVVEFHMDPSDLDIGRGTDPSVLEKNNSHVTMLGDVSRGNIVAFHQPWHPVARDVLGDERSYADWSDSEEQTGDYDADQALSVVRGLKRGFT